MNMFKSTSQKNSQRDFAGSVFSIFLALFTFLVFFETANANIYSEKHSFNGHAHVEHSQAISDQLINSSSPKRLSDLELYAQNSKQRSKSEVMNEVKKRYKNAKILRVKRNSSGTSYSVRILLPNGKVRNVSVSAQK